jgi:protein-disulfide isomerase
MLGLGSELAQRLERAVDTLALAGLRLERRSERLPEARTKHFHPGSHLITIAASKPENVRWDLGGAVNDGWKRNSVTGLGLLLAVLSLAGSLLAQGKVTAADLTTAKSLGSREAPITMEVFADYQCPQCRLFYETVTKQLIDTYVSTGKVYLVHRDFPLSMHTYSHQAAHWLNAAAAAGYYQPVEQALYDRQDVWAPTGQIEPILAGVLNPTEMKKVRLVESTEGSQLDAAVASDIALGTSKHVDGTPTIFVYHRGQATQLPTGGVNYSLLKQYLDYLLAH